MQDSSAHVSNLQKKTPDIRCKPTVNTQAFTIPAQKLAEKKELDKKTA